jgi:hypothetical protein
MPDNGSLSLEVYLSNLPAERLEQGQLIGTKPPKHLTRQRVRRLRGSARPSFANGGSSSVPSPTVCKKPATDSSRSRGCR